MAGTLEERAEYIRSFATSVSHEFKTPLASIRGSVELLQDHIAVMSTDEREKFLQNISLDADRLERLVRGLLDLARADVMGAGNDQTTIGDVLALVRKRYEEMGLNSVVEGDDTLRVPMAPDVFETVLGNLLDNALQHGGTGTKVTIRISVGARDGTDCFILDVQDTGPGISLANAANVFNPFFTTARDRGGSGLGLPIVQSLILAHGGTLSLEPSERGAWFRVIVPRG
jgi:signal transduction histidine kinase